MNNTPCTVWVGGPPYKLVKTPRPGHAYAGVYANATHEAERRKLLQLIRQNPGQPTAALREALGIPLRTLHSRLATLQRNGRVYGQSGEVTGRTLVNSTVAVSRKLWYPKI